MLENLVHLFGGVVPELDLHALFAGLLTFFAQAFHFVADAPEHVSDRAQSTFTVTLGAGPPPPPDETGAELAGALKPLPPARALGCLTWTCPAHRPMRKWASQGPT
ncbi:MAG: hypothetical protein R3E76_04660 [Planctomycetota bacterium]